MSFPQDTGSALAQWVGLDTLRDSPPESQGLRGVRGHFRHILSALSSLPASRA